MTLDITETLAAKSDQINADDLTGGPITVRVESVKRGASAEQPLDVHISGHKPWRPCKTMRRLLAAAWGVDAGQWVGKWLVLYRDDSVEWGGEKTGGIRVKAMSHIPTGGIQVKLQHKRGKRSMVQAAHFAPNGVAVGGPSLESLGLTLDQINAWKATTERPDPVTEATLPQMLAWLAKDPKRVEAVLAVGGEREPGEDG